MSIETTRSHHYQHFEDLQLSSKEFYAMLATMVKSYDYPNVSCTSTSIKEKGFFSSKREYMCISWQQYRYYVCACPFGKSFFISWYLKEEVPTGLFDRRASLTNRAKTFYEMDTELMFTHSISAIIKQAVDKVMADKGFRAPELEENAH